MRARGGGGWHEPKSNQHCKKGRNQGNRGSYFETSAELQKYFSLKIARGQQAFIPQCQSWV